MLNIHINDASFSGVISVRRGDAVLYERAFGCADRSNRRPNTLATRFGIASGTKFFTALAIGKLIAAGKLSFETLLSDCVALPFPRYSPDITIRHLLTHTSGIPDYYDEEKITDFDNFTLSIPWYELRGPRDYLPAFPDEEMKFRPGERFSYSNGGYILLGVVIEELAGMRYQEFVEREIFGPAGMHRSGFFAFDKLPENTALGYIEEEGGGWRTNTYTLPIVGASDGGAYTTVDDLATLWRAFFEYEILPKEIVETYAQPYVKAGEGEHTHYGHGLWIREGEGEAREVYIIGSDAGVSFRSGFSREDQLQVTVISNTTSGAWPVLREIDAAIRNSLAPKR